MRPGEGQERAKRQAFKHALPASPIKIKLQPRLQFLGDVSRQREMRRIRAALSLPRSSDEGRDMNTANTRAVVSNTTCQLKVDIYPDVEK